MDPLIAHINANPRFGVRIQYATLSEYFAALNADQGSGFAQHEGDFVPYEFMPDGWWSGFYTSRPTLKQASRAHDARLRAAEVMFAWARPLFSNEMVAKMLSKLTVARRASAILTHHDAITGTERARVADDYMRMLKEGNEGISVVMENGMSVLLAKKGQSGPVLSVSRDVLRDVSARSFVPIVLFNSLGWTYEGYVRIANVSRDDLYVVDQLGGEVPSDMIAEWEALPSTPKGVGAYDLYFWATVPPMGSSVYFASVRPKGLHSGATAGERTVPLTPPFSDEVVIHNSVLELRFSGSTGRLAKITHRVRGKEVVIDQDFGYYASLKDGAYIFRPKDDAIEPIGTVQEIRVVLGKVVSEVRQVFRASAPIYQVTRIYTALGMADTESFVEMNQWVGPIPGNKELMTRFRTALNTKGQFITDNNGFRTMRRKFEPDPTDYESNFYPMISRASIEDVQADVRLTVFSEHVHAASSVTDGELEMMIHRRLLQDDVPPLGVDEPLNDTSSLGVTFWLHIDDRAHAVRTASHAAALRFNNPIVPLFGTPMVSPKQWKGQYAADFDVLSDDLPQNVHLMTLKQQEAELNRVILRLQHMFEADEDPQMLSKAAVVDLSRLVSAEKRQLIVDDEYTLTMSARLSEVHRMSWKVSPTTAAENSTDVRRIYYDSSGTALTLLPSDIRSFFVELRVP